MRKKAIQAALVIILAVGFLGVATYRYFPVIFGDDIYPLEYVNEINKCADLFDLDKPLLAALILKESGFNPRAVSRAGAMGLTQLMPRTAQGVNARVFNGKYSDFFDPEANICLGAAHLAGLLGTYNGDVTAALIAYNGGDSAARRYLAARSTSVLVTETRLYAPKILGAREAYASLYSDKFTPSKSKLNLPGANSGSAASLATPQVKIEVQKESDKTKNFWKGLIKDVFAQFIKQ